MPLELNGTTGVQDNSGAFVAGTAVASTSGTSIDFTSIPSWVKRITVMFNLVTSSGTSNFLIRLGTTSGIETTGYMSNSAYVGPGANGTGNITNGFVIFHDTAVATTNGSISIEILGGNIWVASGTVAQSHGYTIMMGGSKTALAATLDRIRILTANGTDTFNGGSINILYE